MVRLVGIVTAPVITPDGEENRTAITFTDITDRRAAEDELRAARGEAERANAAKDEFLSRLSHELRTPLNAVLGFAQLLEIDELSQAQDDAVQHILRGGRHLLGMVDDILDITGIGADRMELSPEPVQLAPLIRDTLSLMTSLATASHVRLHFDTTQPAAHRYGHADRRRLAQVLLNLTSNAIKYNHVGGRVEVRVSAADDQLSICVIDTGIGIPADVLARLLHPFDRLGRQALNIEGTGIGLVLAQRLTTLMNGRLEVETTDGHGSTFTVSLPASDPPQSDTATPLAAPGAGGEAAALCTLVYIEDDPSNVALLSHLLTRHPNWTLTHAGTGSGGLQLVRDTRPTAILLDLNLPDTERIEVLRALRAEPATQAIPVAVLSADANPRRIDRLLAAGAQQYLTKPIDVHEVFDFLDKHGMAIYRQAE